jgi:hypothetical protein
MAEAGQRRATGAMAGDDVAAPGLRVGLRDALGEDAAGPFHGADKDVADREQSRCNAHLRLAGDAVDCQPGDDRRRRPAMLHERHEAGIEHARLVRGRHASPKQEVDHVGEAVPTHEVVHIGRGDMSFNGVHVLFPSSAARGAEINEL